MFAVVVALLSFYLAIKVSLTEASQRIRRLRDKFKRLLKGETEETMKKEANLRRRTGAVNGVVAFQSQEPRKYKKKDLSMPFMDSGNWFQVDEDSSYKTSSAHVSNQDSEDNVINMLKVPTENQNGSIFSRMFQQISFILRKDSAISYADVSDKVLASERVKTALKTSVMEDLKGQDSVDSDVLAAQQFHYNRAVHVLHQMRSCISSFLLKIAAWVMYKLLGKILDGIEIHRDQIETIKRVSKIFYNSVHDKSSVFKLTEIHPFHNCLDKLKEKNVPMIYLPLHRSHLDYILVTFILYMNDLRAPLVAAGNNLMIPFFGALLRGLGAFFIKRKLDPQNGQRDFVYRAVLHTYMEESLRAGHSLEFFIEGGRSRTGKAVLPKAGLLSIVVDTLMSGGIKDAYIVPIAMSYEKLLDGNFVSEQLGKPKEMESFTSAIMGIWRTLHSNFGTVRVDFCQPFSLKDFLRAAEYSYNSPVTTLQPTVIQQNKLFFNHTEKNRRRSEYGTEIVSEDHRQLIKDLADYIVYDAFNAYSLMSTNLLAFLFLTKHRKGATLEQLTNSMNWIREEISKRNKTISYFGGSSSLIRRASTLLGKNLVNIDTIHMEWSTGLSSNNNVKLMYYKPSVSLPFVLEMQYYANAVLPTFLLESVVVNAAYSLKSDEQDKDIYVQRSHILKQSLELCSILQFEFIFTPPGTSICTVLNATVDELLENSMLHMKEKYDSDADSAIDLPDLMIDDFFAYGDQHELHQQIKLNSDDDNNYMLHFLRCVLTPFIESYYIAACTLPKLIDTDMEEAAFLQEIKTLGLKKINIGQVYHEECLGLDTLKNALKLFESWKILTCRQQNSQKLYSLRQYYNDAFKLKDIIDRIAKYKS